MVRFRILRVLLVIFGALGVVVIAKSLLVLYALAQGAKAIPEARAIILMSTVVLLVCFGLSAFLIFRLISGRVYRLLTAMEQVRQGEYPLLVVSGKDEIADVTRGFNRMVEEIRTRDSKLKNWSGQRENEMAKLSHNLEVERGKLEVVLQSIGEGIVVLDNENRVLMANRRVADIFGIPLEALSGADLGTLIATVHERLVNPEVVDQQFQELQRNTGSVDEIALRLDGPEGPEIRLYCTPVRGSNGKLFGRIATSLDLSREHQLEQLKSEFVSTISHELRTPLTSIKGSLGLIRSGAAGPVGADLRELLDIAMGNTDRLTNTINDMLDIGQLEQGRMHLSSAHVPLRPAVDHALKVLQGMAQQRQVSIEVEMPAELPLVQADARRLRQVVVNLISNAVKFSKPGGRVVVSASARESATVVAVRDFGVGISEEFRNRLFQKFEHEQGALTRENQGVGLGLAISKGLVEAWGGKIWAESEAGKGSTFYFTVPATVQSGGESVEEILSTRHRTRRLVLVVEDDEDAARVIAYAFQKQGHRVITCHNGNEAVELTRRHRPDLLTLDVSIPGLNGAEVLRQLRADTSLAGLPIICISAQLDPSMPSNDGAFFYLEKPLDLDRLREVTERAFAAAAAGGGAV